MIGNIMRSIRTAWQLIWTLAVRELISMFRVPAGWIILALFIFLSAVLFLNQTMIPGRPGSLRYFFTASAWLLIPIAPAISMRLISEEYRTGSFESLRTTPAGDWAVVLGKYLGSVLFLSLMLAPTLVYPAVLAIVSHPTPDPGPIVAGYMMLMLVGAFYLSVGLLASTLTSSQTLAFLGTMMALILFIVVTSVLTPRMGSAFGPILAELSVIGRASDLGKGVIDSGTIFFFLIGSTWMVALSAGVLESRRLARSRRRLVLMASVFVLATGASVLFAGVLTTIHSLRIDVTSTSAHRLSPRAINMVKALPGETRIVLAIHGTQTDRLALDLVSDVLDSYARASVLIETQIIDLSTIQGAAQISALNSTLRAREADKIDENRTTIQSVGQSVGRSGEQLNAASPMLNTIGQAIDPTTAAGKTNRAFFDQRAALVRLGAQDLAAMVQSLGDDTGQSIGLITAQLAQIEDLKRQLGALADAPEISAPARSGAQTLGTLLGTIVDDLSVALDQLARLHRIDADRVELALQTGEALLVIGPPESGISAVDLDALLPPTEAIKEAGISPAGFIGPRAQNLIATALGQLVIRNHPIVIFVHAGEPGQLLSSPQLLGQTVSRFQERGIDCVEWATLHESDRPGLVALDPIGQRPVVYVILSADSAAGGGNTGITGTKRATAMAQIATRLLEAGESVLVSMNPSIFDSFGDTDPLVAALEPFGINPDPAYTLLTERTTNAKRAADPATHAVPSMSSDDDTHAVAQAVGGLSAVLPWAVPITINERIGVRASPFMTVPGSDSIWAERDWITLWSTPAQSRPYLRDQPVYEPKKDFQRDRWILAAGAWREHIIGSQRVVVVGSNSWLYDALTHGQSRLVDGRITTAFPGNLALLESSIAWLAGLDDLIAPGIDSRPIATIRPMSPSEMSAYRWILLAGIPGLILVGGILTRIIFG